MEEYLIGLLAANTWFIWVIVAIVVALAILSLVLGGFVRLPGIKLGGKPSKQPVSTSTNTNTNTQNNSQNVSLQLGHVYTPEQFEEMMVKAAQRVEAMKADRTISPMALVYEPPRLSEQVIFLLASQMDINRGIVAAGASYTDGWPGISMMGPEYFLRLLEESGAISNDLSYEIEQFSELMVPVNRGQEVAESTLEILRFFAAHIVIELRRVRPGPFAQANA